MSARELVSEGQPPLEAARTALRVWFNTRPGSSSASERSYYDTFDGLLHDAGYVLCHERDAITLERLEGGEAARCVAEPAAPKAPFFATQLPDGELKQIVAAKTGVRALLPIAAVRVDTDTLLVTDLLRQTVARVHADTARVTGADGGVHELQARVRVSGVPGYDRERDTAQQLLEHSALFRPAPAPLVDQAVSAAGGTPGGVSTSGEVPMSAEERADIVVARVLTRLLEVLDATLPGTLSNIDSEFLHDYRVAVRRTRSVLKEMPGVFVAAELQRARGDFRWLQEVTGETRDFDVWALEFEDLRALAPLSLRDHMQPLKAVIDARHEHARAQMELALQSARAQRIREDWEALLQSLVLGSEAERPDAGRAIGELAAYRIRKVHGAMVKLGRAIDEQSDPQQYHDLRKRGKELRYLLELFGARLYDPAVVKPMIKALKGLQDVLGRHQDRDVQVHTLKLLAPEVMQQPDGALALMAIGALVEQLDADAAGARADFSDRFREFASAQQIELVRSTFAR